MGYTKTNRMVTIIQNFGNRHDRIERRVYENEYGREFVIVNRCFINLEHYILDKQFEVYRY